MTKSEAIQQTALTWAKHGDFWRGIGDYKEAARCYEMAIIELEQALEALKAEIRELCG